MSGNILPPPMSETTKSACKDLDSICGIAHWFHEQTRLNERGIAEAFGIDIKDPEHVAWLGDITVALIDLRFRAARMFDYASNREKADPRVTTARQVWP